MTLTEKAKAVASRCEDAYSAKRYTSWWMVAKVILKQGFSAAETEAMMRSIITRWAADKCPRHRKPSSYDVESYLNTFGDDPRMLVVDIFEECCKSGDIDYKTLDLTDEPPRIVYIVNKFLNPGQIG